MKADESKVQGILMSSPAIAQQCLSSNSHCVDWFANQASDEIDMRVVFYYCKVANVKNTITNNVIFYIITSTMKNHSDPINHDSVPECKHEEL